MFLFLLVFVFVGIREVQRFIMNMSFEVGLLIFKLYVLYEIISYEFINRKSLKKSREIDEESKIIMYKEGLELPQEEEEEEERIDLRECIFLLICLGLIIFDWAVYCYNNNNNQSSISVDIIDNLLGNVVIIEDSL